MKQLLYLLRLYITGASMDTIRTAAFSRDPRARAYHAANRRRLGL